MSGRHQLENQTARVALAAYLHDLGKFAERAGAFDNDSRLEASLHLYCPFHPDGRWFSHRHAAHTALAIDRIEKFLPPISAGDTSPFAGHSFEQPDASADSLPNAAAAHHRPVTFLQWIIATADRVASGFEREEFDRYNQSKEGTESGRNHFQARQLTLFEQIGRERLTPAELKHRYPLRPMAPSSIFPVPRDGYEPDANGPARGEYQALWDSFVAGLGDPGRAIPESHRGDLALWLDHFDSLWLTYASAIPSATAGNSRPDVSLYDHSRATAALAAALWRWHEERADTGFDAAQALRERTDFGKQKFLLVQGDFFGIQEFVFAAGGQTQKAAAKLLRGRSFQVSLFTELAALRVLDELGLPPTSQVINAAGKFLIVAPNTPDCAARLAGIRELLDSWFLGHAFGMAGIGLAWEPASCDDFLRAPTGDQGESRFATLLKRLHAALERAKHRRFGLVVSGARTFEADFSRGACSYHGRLPADGGGAVPSCALSRDQIAMGESLVRFDRLLVASTSAGDRIRESPTLRRLELSVFGYAIAFTRDAESTGHFGTLVNDGLLRRLWDFSLPAGSDATGLQPCWSGYARRMIGGYVPRVAPATADAMPGKFVGVGDENLPAPGELETLDMIACEDRTYETERQKWLGVAALGVLKGDIDDLGEMFRVGLTSPTFARWAGLSRQVNAFFAHYLPWLLQREFPSVYTVFAGGDDFVLIGPWRSVQLLAARLRDDFERYVARNPRIHFSAGLATQKPGAPIRALAELGDVALSAAKSRDGGEKNAITCFGETVPWARWPEVESALERLAELRRGAGFSTAYVYGLLQFVEMRRQETGERSKPEAAVWRARLAYRTRRFIVDKLRPVRDEAERRRWQAEIVGDIGERGIAGLGGAYRIVLFNHLYRFREH